MRGAVVTPESCAHLAGEAVNRYKEQHYMALTPAIEVARNLMADLLHYIESIGGNPLDELKCIDDIYHYERFGDNDAS